MVQVNSQTKFYQSRFNKKVKQFNVHSPLREYLADLIDGDEVTIAELACGLVNTIGDTHLNTKVSLTCSDVYADQYNDMWAEHNMKPLHPIEYQDMENLTYEDNTFDIVHCENALDHTEDPYKAVEEMNFYKFFVTISDGESVSVVEP